MSAGLSGNQSAGEEGSQNWSQQTDGLINVALCQSQGACCLIATGLFHDSKSRP